MQLGTTNDRAHERERVPNPDQNELPLTRTTLNYAVPGLITYSAIPFALPRPDTEQQFAVLDLVWADKK